MEWRRRRIWNRSRIRIGKEGPTSVLMRGLRWLTAQAGKVDEGIGSRLEAGDDKILGNRVGIDKGVLSSVQNVFEKF